MELRQVLDKYDYPFQARSNVFFGFELQESIDRESMMIGISILKKV
jgi:hypothetical protein